MDINNQYDTLETINIIKEHKFTKIALQLPDELIHHSGAIITELENLSKDLEPHPSFFVLGDTSYGACCVDEIAAEHVQADFLIHFGRTCFSKPSRIPVFYVFGHASINIENFYSQFDVHKSSMQKVVVMYDPLYSNAINQHLLQKFENDNNVILSTLQPRFYRPASPTVNNNNNNKESCGNCSCGNQSNTNMINEKQEDVISNTKTTYKFCGRCFTIPENENINDYSILYVGSPDSLTLYNLMLNYNKSKVFTYNPVSCQFRQETLNVNKNLMQRYFLVQKAKEAQVIGILVGTLAVANYLDAIQLLKKMIKNSNRKYYTFVVGKLNVPKLANFQEIDLFVLVACPENTLIDSKEFYKPIVTPFELQMAILKDQSWTGDYVTDFSDLLPGMKKALESSPTSEKDEEETEFSFISGTVKPKNKFKSQTTDETEDENSSAVTIRNSEQQIIKHWSPASQYLQQRSYQGLQQQLGETEVTKAVVGRSGIPMHYDNEQINNS